MVFKFTLCKIANKHTHTKFLWQSKSDIEIYKVENKLQIHIRVACILFEIISKYKKYCNPSFVLIRTSNCLNFIIDNNSNLQNINISFPESCIISPRTSYGKFMVNSWLVDSISIKSQCRPSEKFETRKGTKEHAISLIMVYWGNFLLLL